MSSGARLKVVLDTNVFVAAGFNPKSSSAGVLRAVAGGDLVMIWNEATRRETAMILRRIPRLRWNKFEPLFRDEWKYDGGVAPEAFDKIEDPDDRKFAALAAAVGAMLVSNDDHLLGRRDDLPIRVLKPSELAAVLAS